MLLRLQGPKNDRIRRLAAEDGTGSRPDRWPSRCGTPGFVGILGETV